MRQRKRTEGTENTGAPRRTRGTITRDRIRILADMLAAGVYVTRDTPRVLAAKWQCKPATVENLACQAANLVRLSLGGDEQIKAKVLATLDRVSSLCMRYGTEVYPEGHERAGQLKERNAYQWLNTLVQATDRIATLTGIDAPKKVEIKSEFTLEDLEDAAKAIQANTCSTTNDAASSGVPSRTSRPSAGSSRSSRRRGGARSSS